MFKAGDELKSLYAIRSGTIKSYTITEQGDEQITAFHLAGDLVGFDAIHKQAHPSFAQALETAMVCEIPFDVLDDLSGKMPKLRQQIMRLMSNEIMGDQEMILLLSKKNAEERLAAFLHNLSVRFRSHQRQRQIHYCTGQRCLGRHGRSHSSSLRLIPVYSLFCRIGSP